MKQKLALYAGSFSPTHLGHQNILIKAERIFGKGNVYIAIGCNPEKIDIQDFSLKAKELSEKINAPVIAYTCFLHELILQKEEEGFDVILVRGLRNGDDLAYEENQLKYIEEFLPVEYNLNTIFIMCDEKFKHISSSGIRNLEKFREGSAKNYII